MTLSYKACKKSVIFSSRTSFFVIPELHAFSLFTSLFVHGVGFLLETIKIFSLTWNTLKYNSNCKREYFIDLRIFKLNEHFFRIFVNVSYTILTQISGEFLILRAIQRYFLSKTFLSHTNLFVFQTLVFHSRKVYFYILDGFLLLHFVDDFIFI